MRQLLPPNGTDTGPAAASHAAKTTPSVPHNIRRKGKPTGREKIESGRTPSARSTVFRRTGLPRLSARKASGSAFRNDGLLSALRDKPLDAGPCGWTRRKSYGPPDDKLFQQYPREAPYPIRPCGPDWSAKHRPPFSRFASPPSECRAGPESLLCTFRSECLSLLPQTSNYEYRLVRKRHFRTGSQPPAGPVARRQPAAAARQAVQFRLHLLRVRMGQAGSQAPVQFPGNGPPPARPPTS